MQPSSSIYLSLSLSLSIAIAFTNILSLSSLNRPDYGDENDVPLWDKTSTDLPTLNPLQDNKGPAGIRS